MASSGSIAAESSWSRRLRLLTAAAVAAYVVWTLPGIRPATDDFRVPLDGVLHGLGYLFVALLCVHALVSSRTGPAWRLVAAAVVLRVLGFVVALGYLSVGAPLPYPSVADAAWVLSTFFLVAAVALRLHDAAPRLTLLVALDAVGSSLLMIGLVIGILAGPVDTLTGPRTPSDDVVASLLHPVLDVALLVAGVTYLAVVRRGLRRADVLLVAGTLGFVVVDVAYVVLLAHDLWRPGTPVSSLSLVATAAVAYAVVTNPLERGEAPPRRTGTLRTRTTTSVAFPASLVGAVLVAMPAYGALGAPSLTLLLFGAAGGVGVLRGVLTLRVVRQQARQVLGATTQDLRRFQALVEASNDYIGMADVRGQVLYLNPRARELLGLPLDYDVTTLTVADIVPQDGPTSFESRWPLLLERGFWEGESRVVPLDGGEPIPVTTSTFVMRDAGSHEPVAMATIQRDISELRQHENALRDIADQRARLLTRLVQAQEDERAQIAADVHDDSVQSLAVVDLRIGMLRRRLLRDAPGLVATLDEVQESVSDATDRLRHLLFDLESPTRGARLGEALEQAAEVAFADTDVTWRVTGRTHLDLPDGERVTAYRVAKEAMVNARKHADAAEVVVEVAGDEETVVVTVSDDGRGIAPGEDRERPGHRGLAGMRDRALVAGGTVDVQARPGGGTEVRLRLPVTRGVGSPRPG